MSVLLGKESKKRVYRIPPIAVAGKPKSRENFNFASNGKLVQVCRVEQFVSRCRTHPRIGYDEKAQVEYIDNFRIVGGSIIYSVLSIPAFNFGSN
jgi:hypothetical protein